MNKFKAILVAVDGSEGSDRAVQHALDMISNGCAAELHLLNVQPSVGGAVSSFVSRDQIEAYHREEGEKALASAVAMAEKAAVPAKTHVSVGRQGEIVADFARKVGASLVVLGTRGHTGLAGVLMGSVAQDVIAYSKVPVTLVK
ncbi:MAG: universal stress protein [Rhodospirillales bacterium]|nr:universal stress protein [Rhodospirillales bacterium]